MKFLMDNRGGIFLTVVAVLAGILLGLAVYGNWQDAEAILGGEGNVTLTTNPHNFAAGSSGVEATVEDRVCVFCHTPHHASMDDSLINGPLWNHELSTASYTTWSPTLTNSPPYIVNVGFVNVLTTQPPQLDGSSRMCMSCHDGTVGIGSVVSGADITMDIDSHTCLDADGSLKTGAGCETLAFTDLTKKHIVSIPMNLQLIEDSAAMCDDGSQTTLLSYPWDGEDPLPTTVFLRPTLTEYPISGGEPGVSWSSSPPAKYKIGYNYGVQCSTCHDPHFWNEFSDELGYRFLVTATLSDMCIACHDQCPPP